MNQTNLFTNSAQQQQQQQQQPLINNNDNRFSYPNIDNSVYASNDIYPVQYNVADTNINTSAALSSNPLSLTANASAGD